jgi:hypothetical protein
MAPRTRLRESIHCGVTSRDLVPSIKSLDAAQNESDGRHIASIPELDAFERFSTNQKDDEIEATNRSLESVGNDAEDKNTILNLPHSETESVDN